MDMDAEREIDIDFLKPFEDHILLKFIGLHMKFNPDNVKAFYHRMGIVSGGIHCQFDGKLIKFRVEDLKVVLILEKKGM